MQSTEHLTNNKSVSSMLPAESTKLGITAFFIYDDCPSLRLQEALESVNTQRWALMQLHIDDAIALSFRVIKLPTLILHNEDSEETARVFGEQNIIEMIGRVFDE